MSNIYRKIKVLNIIALPLIVQQIGAMIINISDQALIGRISVEAFNGVGLVSGLLSLVVGIFGYSSVIFNIKASRAKGEKNNNKYVYEFNSAILLSLFISVPLMIIFGLSGKEILSVIYGISGETLKQALIYLKVMIIYIPLQMLLFVYGTVFKIEKKTKYIMFFSLFSSLLNVFLDYILIFGKLGLPALGTLGTAIGTVVSLFLNLFIYIILSGKFIKYSFKNLKKQISGIKKNFIDMLPFMGQEILEGGVFTVLVNSIIARFGKIELGTYNILTQLLGIFLLPSYMYGNAIITTLSEIVGSGNKDDEDIIPKSAVIISGIFYVVAFTISLFLRNFLGKLYTENILLINMVGTMVLWFFLANIPKPFEIAYRYSLQTTGKSKTVLYVNFAINSVVIFMMFILYKFTEFKLYGIFAITFFDNLITYFIFRKIYYKNLNYKED